MSFQSEIAADLAEIIHDTDSPSDDCTFLPQGAEPGFAIRGILSAPALARPVMEASVMTESETGLLRVIAADLAAGLRTATGVARIAGLDDLVEARGSIWSVQAQRPGAGGTVQLILSRRNTVGIGPAWGTR